MPNYDNQKYIDLLQWEKFPIENEWINKILIDIIRILLIHSFSIGNFSHCKRSIDIIILWTNVCGMFTKKSFIALIGILICTFLVDSTKKVQISNQICQTLWSR